MSGAKKILIPVVLVAALGAAWVGSGYVAGHKVEEQVKALTAKPEGRSYVKFENLAHKSGFLSGSGTVDLVFEDSCTPGSPKVVLGRIEYNVAHLPMPGSAARFDWKLLPQGEAVAGFKKIFGENNQIGGKGEVGFGGEVKSEWTIPQIALKEGGEVNIPATTGHLNLGEKNLMVDWKLDKATVRDPSQAQGVEIKGVDLNVNLVDRKLGTGKADFGVASVSAPQGIMEGLKISSEAVEQGDRINASAHYGIAKIQVAGKNAKDLALDFAIKGLNTKSLFALSKVANNTCGFRDLNAEQTKQLRGEVRNILAQGFSIAVPKLAGTSDDGTVNAQASLELLPTKGAADAPIQLASQLKGNASGSIKGAIVAMIPEEQKAPALAAGLLVEENGGLSSSIELANGVLKIAGKEFEPEKVKEGLTMAEAGLNAFLSGKPIEPPAPPAPPAEAPAPAQATEK